MHRSDRAARGVAIAALVGLMAAACGPAATPSPTSPPGSSSASGSPTTGPTAPPVSGTVQFWITGDPEEVEAYEALIEAFETAEPGVDVQLVVASGRGDLMTRLSTAFAAGAAPEVFLTNYRFVGQFAARGVLEPLDGRIDGSSAFDLADFYPQAVEAFRFDGSLGCLAQNISSLAVYYNRDLFKAAGVTEPADGWQWNTMIDAATALTIDEDSDGTVEEYGLGVEAGAIIRLAPFVWSAGGELVDDPAHPTRFTLDTPEAQLALSSFFSLRRVHRVIATEEEAESESDATRFLNGRLAMFMQSRVFTPTARTIRAFDWDVAPLPILGVPASILHSDGFCLTSGSANKEAGWRFIEFSLGPAGQEILARTGRTVPSLRSVAESDAYLDPGAKPANSRVWLDATPVVRGVPNISTWPEIEAAVEPILEIAMYGGLDAVDIASQVDAATRDIFARADGR